MNARIHQLAQPLNDNRRSIFSDRRAGHDRRKQDLPMPAGLDRRQGLRRNQRFHSKPWWLSTDYAEELVSEQQLTRERDQVKRRRLKKSD